MDEVPDLLALEAVGPKASGGGRRRLDCRPPWESKLRREGVDEELTGRLNGKTTRRAVVKTGARVAYVAPVIAATSQLSGGQTLARARGRTSDKVSLCHATCSDKNPYVFITISRSALKQHKDKYHKHCPYTDFVASSPEECEGKVSR
jgi:hypothetical protein